MDKEFEAAVAQKVRDWIGDDLTSWGWWDGEEPEDFGFDTFDELMDAVEDVANRISVKVVPND